MARISKRLIQDYLMTFESPEGERVLADLRARAPLLTDTISTANGVDIHRLLIEEGRRSVLLHIYKMLKRDPNAEVPKRALNELPTE